MFLFAVQPQSPASAVTLIQQFILFERNGGKIEDFCIPTGTVNTMQLMVTIAHKIRDNVGFRHVSIKIDGTSELEIAAVRHRIEQTLMTMHGGSQDGLHRDDSDRVA